MACTIHHPQPAASNQENVVSHLLDGDLLQATRPSIQALNRQKFHPYLCFHRPVNPTPTFSGLSDLHESHDENDDLCGQANTQLFLEHVYFRGFVIHL